MNTVLPFQKRQTYCWYKNEPLNYNPKDMAQTQDLQPVLAETVDSTFSRKTITFTPIRINMPAFPVEISDFEGIDDTEDYKSALRAAQQPTSSEYQTIIC